MRKSKKAVLGTFSALAVVATPIAVAISCGKETKKVKSKLDKATHTKSKEAQDSSRVKLAGIRAEFDNSIRKNEQLKIPFVSDKKDKLEAQREYKEMIKDFFTNYRHNGKIITLLASKRGNYSKKISAVIELNKFFSNKADPTKEELTKAFESFKNGAKQSLAIKEFVFFDETKKNDKGTLIKLDPKILGSVSEEELTNLEFIKKALEHWKLIQNLQSTNQKDIDEAEGDPNAQQTLSDLKSLNEKRENLNQEAASLFSMWIS